MYLSRVEVNVHRRDTVRLMSSPHKVHAAVMASFPSYEPIETRTLWRVDSLGPSTYILVLSGMKPDFSHIVDQYGWPASKQMWDTVEYDPYLDNIKEGQVRRFRLTANPVHSVKDPLSKESRGKVMAHVSAEQQKKWLIDRSERCGFRIEDTNAENKEPALEIKSRNNEQFTRDGKDVTLSIVTFEGVLVVKDAALLREYMVKGIGRAKGYGCGLITLAGPK